MPPQCLVFARRQQILALERPGHTMIRTDFDRLQHRRQPEETGRAGVRVRREGQLGRRGYRRAERRQGARDGVRVRQLVVPDRRYLREGITAEQTGVHALRVESSCRAKPSIAASPNPW